MHYSKTGTAAPPLTSPRTRTSRPRLRSTASKPTSRTRTRRASCCSFHASEWRPVYPRCCRLSPITNTPMRRAQDRRHYFGCLGRSRRPTRALPSASGWLPYMLVVVHSLASAPSGQDCPTHSPRTSSMSMPAAIMACTSSSTAASCFCSTGSDRVSLARVQVTETLRFPY
jgi:hypothetical protein